MNFADIFSNTLFVGGSGVVLAGIFGYWIKELPLKLYDYIISIVTSSFTISNYDASYYDLMKHLSFKFKNKNFKTYSASNGMYGGAEINFGIGYGSHILKYDNTFIKIDLEQKDSQSAKNKETIKITKFGRSKKFFENLVKNLNIKESETLNVFYYNDNFWEKLIPTHKRSWDTIFLENETKSDLYNTVKKFINNKEWYLNNGIPYQIGLLFKGPPGTGKTSIIKSLASEFNLPIYYFPISKLSKIQSAFLNIPHNSLVVLEDIDRSEVAQDKTDSNDSENSITLSEVLNSIDGLFSSANGRILIMTTNNADILDQALIRPGRIDKQFEIGFINLMVLKEFINKFYPNSYINYDNIKLRNNITISELQTMMMCGMNVEKLIESICI